MIGLRDGTWGGSGVDTRVDGDDEDRDDGEEDAGKETSLEKAKRDLIDRVMSPTAGDSDTMNEAKQSDDKVSQSDDTSSQSVSATAATLDLILVVVGTVFGQRDLLSHRADPAT